MGERDGRAVGSGVPRLGDAVSGDIVSVWAVAYLSGDFRRTHTPLPHLRRLRLLAVLPPSPFPSLTPLRHSSSRFDSVRRPNFVLFVCFYRRFVGTLCGSKATDAILSMEYFCCDRPNPILQVWGSKLYCSMSYYLTVNWFLLVRLKVGVERIGYDLNLSKRWERIGFGWNWNVVGEMRLFSKVF